ncbi:peptidoglycan-binding domain-containing protein [Cellulomonas composti]|uniref:Peptidoglycan binding-like domain-containing protein n=1 Tax=Cellulomonas composti TaxID=266130 RepID=A0A511JDE0_9CELL|nr:peptidoglycan-binding protein [Cellulomonas composti]GEL95994.1 hypothetical protein CCO02nite_26520 [Cellulomonas composti]
MRKVRDGRGYIKPIMIGSLVGSLLLTAGCSGDGASDLEKAQAQVSSKEKALSDAQASAESTGDAFCTSATDYIEALDRYGDVLTQDAVTVGDVATAGADLQAPRAEVVADGRSATEASQAVAAAQTELDQANAELAAIQAGTSGTPAPVPEVTEASAVPIAPADSVARVQQADEEFTAVQEGIGEDTPLAQASQQFNAAAVALEMSWLRLVADAGCLSDDQLASAQAAASQYTAALQQSLKDAGFYEGEVDGIYGPQTVTAVEALQQANGLPVTGSVDKATNAALQSALLAKGGAAAQSELIATSALQQTLHLAGYWDGPIDGQWTPELTEAVMQLQTDLGVEPTGVVDAATVAAFDEALAGLVDPVEPTEEPEPTEDPEPTEAPETPEPTATA